MSALKQITIVGHVGAAPVLRHTADGTLVACFTVAVNEPRKSGGNVPPVWFRVSAWRRLAEIVTSYVQQGQLILVVGDLRTSTYVAQDGTQRFGLDINADQIQLLSRRQEDDHPAVPEVENPDDIPF